MPSFFTTPASQRKRKREEDTTTVSKKRNLNSRPKAQIQSLQSLKAKRDESISGSESDDEAGRVESEEEDSISESEDEDETGAERRLRLAEQYLENIKGEVDEIDFDAEDIDRDLIAERLQEDVVFSHCISTLLKEIT